MMRIRMRGRGGRMIVDELCMRTASRVFGTLGWDSVAQLYSIYLDFLLYFIALRL